MIEPVPEVWFAFRPGLRLRVAGAFDALKHYEHEYAPARVPKPEPDAEVDVEFAEVGWWPFDAVAVGGHKTVGWRVSLGDPREQRLQARIQVRGWPRSFALSLTQGYFVEPLLSIAAARAGHVLLPGAAIAPDGGLVIVLGQSGAGKTSLSAGALSTGVPVLGDDQVFVDVWGVCSSFPRRLRLYPDVMHTVPAAYARLSRRTRARLAIRRLLDFVSGGYVRPSLPVDVRELARSSAATGGLHDPRELLERRIDRVVLLERTTTTGAIQRRPLGLSSAVEHACQLLEAQRSHLARVEQTRWPTALSLVLDVEREILKSAFAKSSLERIVVPRGQNGAAALEAVATTLGVAASAGE